MYQEQKQFDFQWQRRAIIVDHFGKAIYIQVMWDNSGNLLYPEFQAIKAGNFHQFLPAGLDAGSIEVRKGIHEMITNGYQVRPMFFQGMENDDHRVMMITDIQEPKLAQFDRKIETAKA